MIAMMRIILCEDDAKHLDLNKEYIENTIKMYGEEYQIRTYSEAESIDRSAVEWANVAFLDIDLGYEKQDGIAFAKYAMTINKWIAIVFITSYQEYAQDAFKVQAFGYLEKPVIKRELINIVERLMRYVQMDEGVRFIEVFDNRKQVLVKVEDIIYIEKSGRKVTLYTMSKDIRVTQSIATLEGSLGKDFLKVNQGVLVNKRYVNRLEGDIVYTTTGEAIKISRNRVKLISEQLSK